DVAVAYEGVARDDDEHRARRGSREGGADQAGDRHLHHPPATTTPAFEAPTTGSTRRAEEGACFCATTQRTAPPATIAPPTRNATVETSPAETASSWIGAAAGEQTFSAQSASESECFEIDFRPKPAPITPLTTPAPPTASAAMLSSLARWVGSPLGSACNDDLSASSVAPTGPGRGTSLASSAGTVAVTAAPSGPTVARVDHFFLPGAEASMV